MLRLIILSLAAACTAAKVCPQDICQRVRCASFTAENCVVGSFVCCCCCDSCVQILAEGDACVPMVLRPSAQCAAGLTCDPAYATCKSPIVTKRQVATCAERVQQMQLAGANGLPLLGQAIPKCEADGSYSARQCLGSVCSCVDPQGSIIPNYSASIGSAASMDCSCARDQYAYMQTGLIGKMFSCTPAGSYQRYACQGSVCFCADTLGNMQSGSPSVNIGNIGSLQC